MSIVDVITGLLPSFLQVPLRRLRGAKIGSGTKIRFGTILTGKQIEIGDQVRIGPLAYVRGQKIEIGSHTQIKSLSITTASTIKLGEYVHIAPLAMIKGAVNYRRSTLEVGDHSRIFPFCWLEPGEGIKIGQHVGIGGHGLIFTHGVWTDYLRGGPVSFGSVTLEDNVWLPWRVFILPGVTIGANSIIGGGSVVNKSIPPNSLAGGMPAKVIKEGFVKDLAKDEKKSRAATILAAYADHCQDRDCSWRFKPTDSGLSGSHRILIDSTDGLSAGDLYLGINRDLEQSETDDLLRSGVSVIEHRHYTARVASPDKYITDFIAFLRRYGIRLYVAARDE